MSKIVFITGQQVECTQDRFDRFYKPAIVEARDQGCAFVLGAAAGVDKMASALLQELGVKDVTIFDKGDKTGDGAEDKGWTLTNGWSSYPSRDDAMIHTAHEIIVYLFENAVTSGTWRNLMAFALTHIKKKTRDEHDSTMLLAVARACARDTPSGHTTWLVNAMYFGVEDLFIRVPPRLEDDGE